VQVVLFQDAHLLDLSREDMAVITVSQSLNTLGIIEGANSNALSMFGYNKRDMVGKNVSLIVPPPMNARHDLYLKAFLDSGRSVVSGPATHESTGLTTSTHTHV
jgi:PAS domain S-box-containing protein